MDIRDEVNMLPQNISTNLKGKSNEKVDDTNVCFGKFRESGREKKVSAKFKNARSPSPYVLVGRQPSPAFRPNSAPLFMRSELDLRIVDIPLSNDNIELAAQQKRLQEPLIRTMKNDDIHHRQDGAIPKAQKAKLVYAADNRKDDLTLKYASTPDLYGDDISIPELNKHFAANSMSSNEILVLNQQRRHSVSSGSSVESSLSPLSDSESEDVTQIHNNRGRVKVQNHRHLTTDENYHRPGTVSNGKVHFVDIDDSTVYEGVHKQAVKKGTYKPAVTSPRVKEKRLKIRNILKNKKGSFIPGMDEMQVRDKHEVNHRIYAKNRGLSNDDGIVKNKHHCVNDRRTNEEPSVSCTSTESESTVNDVKEDVTRDTDSVDNFIAGTSDNTVSAKPIIVDKETGITRPGQTLPQTPDSDEGPLNLSGSPQKAQPPKKPARTKHKNKNLPADLNFSKYKITAASNPELNRRTSPLSLCSSDAASQSDVRYMSHDRLKGPDNVRKISTSSTDTQEQVIPGIYTLFSFCVFFFFYFNSFNCKIKTAVLLTYVK